MSAQICSQVGNNLRMSLEELDFHPLSAVFCFFLDDRNEQTTELRYQC